MFKFPGYKKKLVCVLTFVVYETKLLKHACFNVHAAKVWMFWPCVHKSDTP